jgi:hypothetical protein
MEFGLLTLSLVSRSRQMAYVYNHLIFQNIKPSQTLAQFLANLTWPGRTLIQFLANLFTITAIARLTFSFYPP